MSSNTSSWLTNATIAFAGLNVLFWAHTALATTARGVPFTDPMVSLGVGLSLLVGRLFKIGLPDGVTLGPWPTYLTIFTIGVVVSSLTWWVTARALKGRFEHPGGGTLTRTRVRKQNLRDKSAASPLGFVAGKPFHATSEDSFAVIAMSGAGKTMRVVVQMVKAGAGAVLTTSTRLDVLMLTAGIRRAFGKILVFAPEYKWIPKRWRCHWDIVAGCENTAVAMERADAIVAARPLGNDTKNGNFFGDAAGTILRCMMHAAALGDPNAPRRYTMRDVVEWMQDFSINTPYTILRDHPDANHSWHGELKRFCRGEALETRNSTEQTVSLVLKALAIDSILDAVCPAEGVAMLDTTNFHATTDTLYLLSKKKGLAAPVITALVESLQSAAMDAGEQAPLSPVLTMVLDEICNVCPLPSAPELMTDGRGHGIQVAAIAQGRRQLIQRFGENGADTIINLSSCLLVFGGSRDVQQLQDLSALADEREVTRTSTSTGKAGSSDTFSTQKERVLTVGKLREIEEGKAVMFYRNLPVAIITLPAWWEGDDKADYEASQAWVRKEMDIAA